MKGLAMATGLTAVIVLTFLAIHFIDIGVIPFA